MLIILVLLAALAVIVAANASALFSLKEELKRIDQQQQRKFEKAPAR